MDIGLRGDNFGKDMSAAPLVIPPATPEKDPHKN